MGIFSTAYNKTMTNEGGFVLHNVKGDKGGMTYAGIARNYHPDWSGWKLIDSGNYDDLDLVSNVKRFYKKEFWDRLKLSEVESQLITNNIFDFGVNAGYRIAAKLAQIAVNTTVDGVIGPKTIQILNHCDEKEFELKFLVAKIKRYAEICNRDRSQSKFLLGWVNRSFNMLEK